MTSIQQHPKARGGKKSDILRCFSVHEGCTEWLSELPDRPFSLDRTHLDPQNSMYIFWVFFFHIMLCKLLLRDPRRSAVSKIPKRAHLAPTSLPRSKSLRWHFCSCSEVWSWFYALEVSFFYTMIKLMQKNQCLPCRGTNFLFILSDLTGQRSHCSPPH